MTDTRTEFTRLTLFVPGSPPTLDTWGARLASVGLTIEDGRCTGLAGVGPITISHIPNDGHFAEAFCFGTVAEPMLAALARAPSALVCELPVDLLAGRAAVVTFVRALRDAGALAVRIEESKMGWAVDDWLDHFASDDPRRWYRGAVFALVGDDACETCGMHAFSLPDALVPVEENAEDARYFADVLCMYQLAEDPTLASGHTFAPDADTPRRVLVRWPALAYSSGHSCHNPYGVWRCESPQPNQVGPSAEALLFMPSLHALLVARQRAQKSPLTRADVLAVRDKAACMSVDHGMARQMERARGYADLDPELVWEQWRATVDAG
ncbi:MAG: hypothetical protein R3B40_07185 [Polyangiales bacterium]